MTALFTGCVLYCSLLMVLLISLVIILIKWLFKKWLNHQKNNSPPVPGRFFLLNWMQFWTNPPWHVMNQCVSNYGSVISFKLPTEYIVVLNSFDCIIQVICH